MADLVQAEWFGAICWGLFFGAGVCSILFNKEAGRTWTSRR